MDGCILEALRIEDIPSSRNLSMWFLRVSSDVMAHNPLKCFLFELATTYALNETVKIRFNMQVFCQVIEWPAHLIYCVDFLPVKNYSLKKNVNQCTFDSMGGKLPSAKLFADIYFLSYFRQIWFSKTIHINKKEKNTAWLLKKHREKWKTFFFKIIIRWSVLVLSSNTGQCFLNSQMKTKQRTFHFSKTIFSRNSAVYLAKEIKASFLESFRQSRIFPLILCSCGRQGLKLPPNWFPSLMNEARV